VPEDVVPVVATDLLGRGLRALRISVTDRCNFRCRYCMPRERYGPAVRFLPRKDLLSFEEIARLARIFAGMGARKVRLTGGEPLLRHELPKLVGLLSGIPGLEVALITNGSVLAQQAVALAAAGLRRVTVSLDSLDDAVFRAMNDVDFPVARVVEGIEAAAAAGLSPVKVNAVVRRGVNDHTVLDLARHFKRRGHVLRFIEFMDVGSSNGWRPEDVVPAGEILARIHTEMPLEPVATDSDDEVAARYRYCDGEGEIGLIASVTQPFCASCTRGRLSADGRLFTCLFATAGVDLAAALRCGWDDHAIRRLVERIWAARSDRYSELRGPHKHTAESVEMSYVGG
jgi:cyclic pyranopterin phosphate synthase